MKLPRVYRDQFLAYEKAGFHVKEIEPSKGSHLRVTFEEFPEVQFLTMHLGCPRALKNNISRFRGLAAKAKEQQ